MRLSKKASSSASSTSGTSTSTSSSGALFPLPEGFFPKLELSPMQVQRYERQMAQVVRDALAAYARHEAMGDKPAYCEPWRWMSSVENLIAVQSCPGKDKTNTKSTKSRIFGRINGDYRQQMDFYYAETAKDLVEWHELMYGNTVDAAVLANIHTAGAANQQHMYMGIKWLCVAAPRLLTRKRDQLFLEYMMFTTDLEGRDVGVRITLPIDLPECADLAEQLHVKRINTHTVTILRAAANDPSSTEFFQMTETDSAVHYVNAAHYKREMSVIKDLALCVDARRISHQSLVGRDKWVSRAERSACAICQRGFSATRRHHHCRLCGEVICGGCVLVRKARRRSDKKSVKTKVCLQCVTAIRGSDSSSSVDFSASASYSSSSFADSSGSNNVGFFSKSSSRSHHHHGAEVSICDSEVGDTDGELESSYDCGASDWETGSEDGDSVSSSTYEVDVDVDVDGRRRNSSSSSTISLTESSTSSLSSSLRDKSSFMTTLDVIVDRSEEPELVDFSKDLECLFEDVTEVIDTKDMTPLNASSAHQKDTRPVRVQSMRNYANCKSSSTANGSESLRSIGQCLAEQEELLKMMVLAASSNGNKNRAYSTT